MYYKQLKHEAKTLEARMYLTDCVKYFHSEGIISSYSMLKREARRCHNNNKDFTKILFMLNSLKVVRCLDNRDIIYFVPEILDAITKDEGYIIGNPRNNILVNQGYALTNPTNRRVVSNIYCATCKISCETKTQLVQHKLNDSHIKKITQRYSNWNKYTDDTVKVEINEGTGNSVESCYSSVPNVVKVFTITNANRLPITVENITVLNKCWENLFAFDNFNTTIAETEVFNAYIKVPAMNSTLNLPILFSFLCEDNLIEIVKELTIYFYDEETLALMRNLEPTKPYKRVNPVIKELDGVIIPSDYEPLSTKFDEKIKLKDYKLPNNIIEALNAGLDAETESPTVKQYVEKILNDLKPLTNATPKDYKKILDLLLFIEEHQMKINIRTYDTVEELQQIKQSNLYKLMVPELSEHRPSLLIGDTIYVSENNSKVKYQGVVQRKNLDNVELKFCKSFSEVFIAKKKFNINFTYNRRTIKVEHQAVSLLREQMINRFFPISYTGSNAPKIESFIWFNNRIKTNTEQQTAVKSILNNTSSPLPYIIFGPPGTGKTMTIVEAIMQIWKLKKDERVLVCTPSNSAANVVARRLAEVIPASEMLRYLSYSCSINEVPAEVVKFCNYDGNEFYYPSNRQIQKYRIVISTLTNSARFYNAGMEKNFFSYIFLDESGHAAETETLVPITSVLSDAFGSIILTGDPKQLGPIIHSTIAKKYGFETSMLERLMSTTEVYSKKNGVYDSNVLTKLLRNYRSHPAIIKIPNEKFYDGELIPIGNDLSNFALNSEILINRKFPMIFHSVIGNEQRESNSPSFFNTQEVLVITSYLKDLVGNRINGYLIKEQDIGIIAPYRKQVEKIKTTARKLNFANITIGSVEQLQGQEKLIIIISTVRSKPDFLTYDAKYHLGFLGNPKRFNVAITRAKALVIVIGNHTILQNDPYWRAYIEECIANNSCKPRNISLAPQQVDPNEINLDGLNIQDDSTDFSRGNN